MLGNIAFPCLTSGPSSLRTEDCLVFAYIILALLLSIVAYDYQVQLFIYLESIKYIFGHIFELEILSLLSCAGNRGSGDVILLVSCMCWVCFAITC